MKYQFRPSNLVCSQNIAIDVEDGKIAQVEFLGGCPGNLTAVSRLVVGMTPQEAAAKLKGICCGGKPTSCPDQLALALLEIAKRSVPATTSSR